ncbi:TetR/AcrR family transcriptional regulator [Leuconostoc holzapfelii]|uniref:TetR/AcrR family transcriptional regulator n=1 Tax=Leuconostoc holzapfelii TaxID=434464 RepID=A0A846ZER9_9LACO|nr:TetR/AcrR family transcriptional regulator [Leuconostoc holzapfelii]MCT8390052.1 TetR/AcrR family transcriptional regulator [Leuconostoc holzapfelii]NKZ18594.1 TetR/AcrR family transcriptional regulator [Leuconostoc holzapfelii]
MIKKEDARVLRTKKAIEEATISLLTAQPDFSITTLLNRAQVTRGTFYKYYQNKEHLISEVNNSLLLEFTQHIQGHFRVAKMVQAISARAAFYNAVLNLHSDGIYFATLMSRMRTQMLTQLTSIEDEARHRKMVYQWEAVIGAFWALISKWLLENMDLDQTALLQEFSDILRVNTTAATQTGLNLFDFEVNS